MKKLLLLAAMATLSASAMAATITFEDLTDPGSGTPISNEYQGLSWSNFYSMNAAIYNIQPSGYGNGRISGTNVAYNGFGDPAMVISAGANEGFSIQDGYFTGAWNDGLEITATAVFTDQTSKSLTFTVDSTGPTHQYFDWTDIQSLTFSSAGGVQAGYGGGGTQFVVDNLTVNAVPELGSNQLMLLGMCFGYAIVAARRRAN